MSVKMTLPMEAFKGSPSGATVLFVKMGGRGYKVFESRKDRDLAYSNQVRLSALDLAPEAYFIGEIAITGLGDFSGYVYETELAECCVKYPREADYGDYDDYQAAYAEYQEDSCKYDEATAELKEKLESEGCNWRDAHAGNVGFIDGEAVIIDCGDHLFSDGSVVRAGRRLAKYSRA